MALNQLIRPFKIFDTIKLILGYKGHDLYGSLVKILAKIGVRSYGSLDKHFQIRVKLISYFVMQVLNLTKPSQVKLMTTEVNLILLEIARQLGFNVTK